jgi:hypothetical protein
MNQREELKEALDIICERIMETRGTLRTEVFNYDYQIRHMVEQCFKIGIRKTETDAIIAKYEPKAMAN